MFFVKWFFSNLPSILLSVLLVAGGLVGYVKIRQWIDFQDEVFVRRIEEARTFSRLQDKRIDELFKRIENVARARTEVVTVGEIKRIIRNEINDLIEKTVEEQNERIVQVGKIVGELKLQVKKNTESDKHYKRVDFRTGEEREYYFKRIHLAPAPGEKEGPPVAWAMFFPNNPEGKKWRIGTYPLEFHTKTVVSEREDGTFNNYTELSLFVKRDEFWKNREYPIRIPEGGARFKMVPYDRSERSFKLWDPHLKFGLGAGIDDSGEADAYGYLGVSLMSYGPREEYSDWDFIEIGGAFGLEEGNPGLYLSPFSVNLGKYLPLVEEFRLQPGVVWSGGRWSFGLTLSHSF